MNAGNLDSRITIRNYVTSSIDLHGEAFPIYATASVWAKAKSVNGGESNVGGVYAVNSNYQFTIRNDTTPVDESSVIIFNGFDYNIKYIDQPFGRNQWLLINAERVING